MKNIRFVSYITIMLILFQSFSTVANSLDYHATDPQHLQQAHQDSIGHTIKSIIDEPSDKQVKKLNDSKGTTVSQHNPADCHHCGHCNGTHVHWVGQHALHSSDLALQSHQFHYLRAVIDAPINQLLRPPKA
jgi:hypothetical protein